MIGKKYPIIHIDFSNSNLETAQDVKEFLQDELNELSRVLELPLRGHSLSKQFEYLIKDAALSSSMKKVVIKAVYLFEFKLNKSAKKAVSQIVDRHYYEKFQSCGLPIRMIGVNFNSAKGRIDGWKEMA